eukprot:CAMPEP_0115839248 /NCGR_PEP_ID=MMETSP0287-20121206/6155_1 /TAXON_ID=412157 /ORGANISM="Chrysochromulina rotalis, Strain UIO044" /LENGTH=372 /DNA_ID=CAMNT_0003292817 /DNA_START=22 /DNA_END=1140 /DNA_ORIENTATION=+
MTTTLHREAPRDEGCGAIYNDFDEHHISEVSSLTELECRLLECKTLAVVKYHKANCRLCRAFKPKFDQWARDWQGHVSFFSVSLESGRDIFDAHHVQLAPYVCLFAGEAGKVYGAPCGEKFGGASQIRADIASHLDPARLSALRAAEPSWAREPARKFVGLVNFLRALGEFSREADDRTTGDDGEAVASLSEAQLGDLHALFSWIDRDGSGAIDLADAVHATRALSPGAQQDDTQPLVPFRLALYRICQTTEALDAALHQVATADTGGPTDALSRLAFVRLMARLAVSDRSRDTPGRPPRAILAAHFALSANGSESITRSHARDVLLQMMEPDAESELLRSWQMEQGLGAFEEKYGSGISLKGFANLVDLAH